MSHSEVTRTIPAILRPDPSLAAIERSVREADAAAFPVPSRIVRRMIRHEIDLPGIGARVPHRKSLVAAGPRVRLVIMNDELGIEPGQSFPDPVLLLARPEEHELETMTAAALCEHYRRLHLHARVHVAMEEKRLAGRLDETTVRRRIEAIGLTAFDEIGAVLHHEAFLLPPVSPVSVYIEFAAVFLELRYFAPDVLATYFPTLDDFHRIETILREDVDADALMEITAGIISNEIAASQDAGAVPASQRNLAVRKLYSARATRRLLRDAASASARGNDVRAAILHIRGADCRDAAVASYSARLASHDIGRLAHRLRQALGFDLRTADVWRELLTSLLMKSAYGFWNPDARMLYDLQKVCLDSERATYVIDLGEWLRSFGRRPLKRPLPAQREVLMSKHLRVAMGRLSKVQVSTGQREHLSILLREAATAAEHRLRHRLRPALEQTLTGVGFLPRNLPERVAFRKIVEELLDSIVEHGFLTMGHVRDAIARNNLKLDDVRDPVEVVNGDRLLRADRKLADVLDGVYQRGAFYLRLLQSISSCAFGTQAGRFLTLYGVIPFGGAFVLLSGSDHLIHEIQRLLSGTPGKAAAGVSDHAAHRFHLANPLLVVLIGLFLLGLMHNSRFRRWVWSTIRMTGHLVRIGLIDLPRWLAEVTFINWILRSPPLVFFRKRLLTSALLTAAVCWLVPRLGWYQRPSASLAVVFFVAAAATLNSRAGRDIEELAAERLQLAWHRVRVHIFVALFDLIMDSFKRLLEWVERFLYEVDEWLRFKSGESSWTLAVKAVLGFEWSIVRFFVRFFVTVLIEPQINPIKHFPVVTVSHKLIAPVGFPLLSKSLIPVFGSVLANTIATTVVFLLPGMVGFLVWELRGNWRLYAANRHRDLRPVIIGSHGETLTRLMKLGLHSGTVPRLFARLRRVARRSDPSRRLRQLMVSYAKLHHLEVEIRRFFDRELLDYLSESQAFHSVQFEVGAVEVGTNSLRVEILAPARGEDPCSIAFEDRGARLIASIRRTGWTQTLQKPQREVLIGALIGFYRIGGVDLVREQIAACLEPECTPYQVTEAGLTLPATPTRRAPIVYDLDEFPLIIPKTDPASLADGRPIDARSLVFGRTETLWTDWVDAWRCEEMGEPYPDLLPPIAHSSAFLPLS
jgi:hypothetical protein